MKALRSILAGCWAAIVFFATLLLLAVVIGQMFDSIDGWWGLIPVAGEFAVAAAAAIRAFRSAAGVAQ